MKGEGLASSVLPIAAAGWPFILAPLALALGALGVGWPKTALAFGLLAAFMAFFFRDPERHPPAVPGAVLAPADGRVTEIREAVEDAFVGTGRQVSIFLSPLDVHVNRAPIAALVADVQYRPGAFRPAYRTEASEANERTTIALQGQEVRVVVRQIAGVLARRIVCRVRPGDKVAAGERIGLIKFGSRVDLVVPWSVRLSVGPGDRVRAGETVMGVME